MVKYLHLRCRIVSRWHGEQLITALRRLHSPHSVDVIVVTCSPGRSDYCFLHFVFLFPLGFLPLLFKTHNDLSSKNNVSRCGCKLRLNPNRVFRLRNVLSVPEHFRGTRGQRTHTHSPQMTGLGLAFLIRSAECRKDVCLSRSLLLFIPKGGHLFLPCYSVGLREAGLWQCSTGSAKWKKG